jgi:hypothetical protein
MGSVTVPLFEILKLPTLRWLLLPPLTTATMALVPNRLVASKPRTELLLIETMLAASPGMPATP